MRLFGSLRNRVLLIVTVATLPLFAFTVDGYRRERDTAVAEVERDVRRMLRSALEQESQMAEHARQVLRIMANANDLRDLDPAECSGLATRLLRTQADFNNIGAALPDGRVFCSGRPLTSPVNVADRAWFREGLMARDMTHGHYVIGRISGEATIAFGYPLRDANDRLRAVLFGASRLDWVDRLAAASPPGPGWAANVIARDGTVIARHPDPERLRGQRLPEPELVRFIAGDPGEAVRELKGLANQSKLYGVAPLASTGSQVYLAVGADTRVALAPIESRFGRALALAALVAGTSFLLAWLLLQRGIVGWARRLAATVHRFGAGDLAARVGPGTTVRDLAELSAAFDDMAERIARDAGQRTADLARINALNRLYALLSAINQAIIAPASREELFATVCRIAVEVGGFRLAWVGLRDADGGTVVPAFSHGTVGYLDGLRIPLDDPIASQGPTAVAVRSGHIEICNDIAADPRMVPWRERMLAGGFHASVAIPLREEGRVIGMLALYAAAPGFFDPEEIALLDECGEDIGHALDVMAQRKALDETRRLLQTLIDASEAVIYVFDREGRCLLANRRFGQLLGIAPDAMRGQTRDAMLPPEVAAQHRANDLAVIATGTARTLEEFNDEADGRHHYLSVKFPLRDATGEVRSVGGISTDITPLKRAEEEIHALNASLERRVAERTLDLEEANRELESFSYSVSHDLRAPLRALSGFSEILLRRHRENLNDEGRHYLDNVRTAADRMAGMIEDLLRYSRVGRAALEARPVPLAPLFEELRQTFAARIAETGAVLDIVEPLATPQGDPRLIEQCLANLLDNALKYHCEAGTPRVTVSARDEGAYTKVSVADNGIGIPPQYHDKVFDVFVRLHSEDDYPGTGIGLAIVRKCARLMGGDAGIASGQAVGSTFWLRLPTPDPSGRRAP